MTTWKPCLNTSISAKHSKQWGFTTSTRSNNTLLFTFPQCISDVSYELQFRPPYGSNTVRDSATILMRNVSVLLIEGEHSKFLQISGTKKPFQIKVKSSGTTPMTCFTQVDRQTRRKLLKCANSNKCWPANMARGPCLRYWVPNMNVVD